MKVKARCDIETIDILIRLKSKKVPSIKCGDTGVFGIEIMEGELFILFNSDRERIEYRLPYELKEWFVEIP